MVGEKKLGSAKYWGNDNTVINLTPGNVPWFIMSLVLKKSHESKHILKILWFHENENNQENISHLISVGGWFYLSRDTLQEGRITKTLFYQGRANLLSILE